MVLLRESGMPQPAIAEAMGVSLSTVNRAHMAYDDGVLAALKSNNRFMSLVRQAESNASPIRLGSLSDQMVALPYRFQLGSRLQTVFV
jgi:hypothetical protein